MKHEHFDMEISELTDGRYCIIGRADYPLPAQRKQIEVLLLGDNEGAFLGVLKITTWQAGKIEFRWMQ